MLKHSGKFLSAHRGTVNVSIAGQGVIDGGGRRKWSLHMGTPTFINNVS